jgi:hypothetical protein
VSDTESSYRKRRKNKISKLMLISKWPDFGVQSAGCENLSFRQYVFSCVFGEGPNHYVSHRKEIRENKNKIVERKMQPDTKWDTGVWQGVAMDSLKFHPGPLCPTLLCPVGEESLKQPYGRFRGDPPARWAVCGCLLPFWIPLAVRL